MTSPATSPSRVTAVRVAGVGYLLSPIIPLLSTFLVYFKLIVPGDDAATANNLVAHELLFRVGLASDLVMAANVLMLSLALYVLLEAVSRRLALFALLLRLGDTLLVGVAVLSGLLALLLLSSGASAALDAGQRQALAGLLLHVRSENAVMFLFVGSGAAISCFLFFESRLIPRALAAFGIVSFVLLPVYSFVSILAPGYAARPSIQGSCYAPSCLFEVVVGGWLLIKGAATPAASAAAAVQGPARVLPV